MRIMVAFLTTFFRSLEMPPGNRAGLRERTNNLEVSTESCHLGDDRPLLTFTAGSIGHVEVHHERLLKGNELGNP